MKIKLLVYSLFVPNLKQLTLIKLHANTVNFTMFKSIVAQFKS